MTKDQQIAELDREFGRPGATMHLAEYQQRHQQINARADDPTPTPAPAAVAQPAPEITGSTIAGLMKGIAAAIGPIFKSTDSRIAALEKRIAALEEKPHLKYVGVYDPQRQYNEADIATEAGGMFHCNRATRDRPGTSDAWTLCVKRGRDAR